MTYKTKFSVIIFNKLKYNPIADIDSKTPDLMSFWMQFFNSQGRVKRIVFKKFCFLNCFFLYWGGKVFKETVESCRCRDFHLCIFKKLGKGFPFCGPSFFMVFFSGIKKIEKLLFVKSGSVTKGFEVLFAYFQMNTFRGLFDNISFKFGFHYNTSFPDVIINDNCQLSIQNF